MPRTIYLLRHGETAWNQEWRLQGQQDTDLSPRGREQARKASRCLRDEQIGVIYSSDLKRARDTAAVIAGACGREVREEARLREISFGRWEGLKYEEMPEGDKKHFDRWLQDPDRYPVPGGETLETMSRRVNSFVQGLVESPGEEKILLVTHGGPVKALLSEILGIAPGKASRLVTSPASLSVIQYSQGTFYLTLFNCTCFLRGKNKLQ